MSIAGRTRTDAAPVAPIDRVLRVATLTSARSQRGWRSDGVRLGSVEDGCLATGPGGRAAVFNGRIDNADELARALGLDPGHGLDAAGLALRAHAKWSDAFANRIIGDWGCALWDGERRTLVLAVDPMALRPIYYHRDAAGGLLFASEQRALWADPDVPREIDEARLAEWLTLLPGGRERSFYRDIARVPPGGMVTWTAGRVCSALWWRPLDAPMLKLRSHAEYCEAVRASLETAVACRIAGNERIGSHLSGGLDSSSVTALAARQLGARGSGLTAFTAVPSHGFAPTPGRFGNEWDHAATLAARYPNIDHVAVPNDDMPLLDAIALRDAAQDVPQLNIANMVWSNGIERAARARGIGVMLTGSMGNATFSHAGGGLIGQQVRAAQIPAMLATLLALRRSGGWRWMTIAGALADAVLPRGAASKLRRALGRGGGGSALYEFSAIRSDFVDRSHVATLASTYGGDARALAPRDSRLLRLTMLARSDFRGDFARATRRLYGIDTRDPTMDRRLFELCLSIPEAAFLHRGVPRAIARGAMADALPDAILHERRKGLQGADWAVGFDAAVPALKIEMERLRASRTIPAWLDLDRMDALLAAWPGAQAGQAHALDYQIAFSRAFATGRFLRQMEGGNA